MTFQQCLDKSLQIAHYFQSEGFKKVNLCPLYFLMKTLHCLVEGRHRVCLHGEQTGLLLLLDGTEHDRSDSLPDQQQLEAAVSEAHHHRHLLQGRHLLY